MADEHVMGRSNWVFIFLGVCSLFFLTYVAVLSGRADRTGEPIVRIEFIGTYQTSESGPARQVTGDIPVTETGGNQLILRGRFSSDVPVNTRLHFYMSRMTVLMKLNGQVIMSYGLEGEYLPVIRSVGTEWFSLASPGISIDDKIEIIITDSYPGIYKASYDIFLKNIYGGDGNALLLNQVSANIIRIGAAFLIFIMGLSLLASMMTLKFIMKASVMSGYFSCAMLLICGSTCTFIDYQYVTLLFPDAFMVNMLDYLTQFFIVEFLLAYLYHYIRGPGPRLFIKVLIYIWSALILVYYFLLTTGMRDTFQVLDTLLLVSVIFVVSPAVFLFIESKAHQDRRTRWVIRSGILLALFALAEIINCYITKQYWIVLFQFGLMIFTVIQFFVMMDYAREKLKKARETELLENELTRSRIGMMISQIQPHFLYNSLAAIEGLCIEEPALARKAISSFAHYLRGNIDSVNGAEFIHFSQEIQHINYYLELEKTRFGERLKVSYDFQTEDFFLPPLTVQPLVENAVRHGVTKKRSGGSVTVSTKDAENSIIIVVNDDGRGFDVAAKMEDGRVHVGIENVSQRLAMQCGGTLVIESKIGRGTTAVITLPRLNGHAGPARKSLRPDLTASPTGSPSFRQ
ncbi:hypothetical protein C4J81_17650 [Deltaproteobacteria bacterium Smac51]|nr:hypothetical protein C4J81_17650 [Deltaproteobacteria bacterium Smac51]